MSGSARPRRISRVEVLKGFLSLFDRPSYLEIGVFDGATFRELHAARKVAVDPSFRFDVEEARRADPAATFHQAPSDVYFGALAAPDERFDVIYLDGLHTAEQTLRDLLNAFVLLKPHGVIVVDDVVPDSYAASLANPKEARRLRTEMNVPNRSWMGDVYRVVFFVDTFCQQFRFRTIADNHGQLVLWRGRRPAAEIGSRSLEAVGRIPYHQVILDRATFRLQPYAAILEEVRGAVGGRAP